MSCGAGKSTAKLGECRDTPGEWRAEVEKRDKTPGKLRADLDESPNCSKNVVGRSGNPPMDQRNARNCSPTNHDAWEIDRAARTID
jgi:hypothetical protein